MLTHIAAHRYQVTPVTTAGAGADRAQELHPDQPGGVLLRAGGAQHEPHGRGHQASYRRPQTPRGGGQCPH